MTKLPPWSFTFLNTYMICPAQCNHVYVLKDVKRPETKEMKHGNDVHEAMERRLKPEHKPLPKRFAEYEHFAQAFGETIDRWVDQDLKETKSVRPDDYKLEIEAKIGITMEGFACNFFDDNVWGRGKIDVALINYPKQTASLTDWKTGKCYEKPFELKVQAVLLQAKYPELRKIVGHYVWLKDMEVGEQHDLSDTRATWNEICETMHKVEEAHQLDHWPVKENILCRFCPVVQCVYNKSKGANE